MNKTKIAAAQLSPVFLNKEKPLKRPAKQFKKLEKMAQK